MTGNEYQILASRTISRDMTKLSQESHALHGMVAEIGELHGIYQKYYQGHYDYERDEEHRKKELGDLLWFIAEYCTVCNWNLDEIMQINIDKLVARYPEGFSVERSLNRKSGDI